MGDSGSGSLTMLKSRFWPEMQLCEGLNGDEGSVLKLSHMAAD